MSLSRMVVSALSLSLLAPTLASAAPAGYCHHYADLAVAQLHWNQAVPGCFKGYDNRWNADWSRHYDWCLSADWNEARAEDSYRGGRIHQCRMNAWGHP